MNMDHMVMTCSTKHVLFRFYCFFIINLVLVKKLWQLQSIPLWHRRHTVHVHTCLSWVVVFLSLCHFQTTRTFINVLRHFHTHAHTQVQNWLFHSFWWAIGAKFLMMVTLWNSWFLHPFTGSWGIVDALLPLWQLSTTVVCTYVCILRARVQPTLDPYAEAFL